MHTKNSRSLGIVGDESEILHCGEGSNILDRSKISKTDKEIEEILMKNQQNNEETRELQELRNRI